MKLRLKLAIGISAVLIAGILTMNFLIPKLTNPDQAQQDNVAKTNSYDITLKSPNQDIVQSQKWTLTLPSSSLGGVSVASSERSGLPVSMNTLTFTKESAVLTADGIYMDGNQDGYDEPAVTEVTNPTMSSQPIHRIKHNSGSYVYITYYKTGKDCNPGEGTSAYEPNYCGIPYVQGVKFSCSVTTETDLQLCDKIMSKITITHQILN